MKRRRNIRLGLGRLFLFILMVCVLFSISGCGKKGDPVFKTAVHPEAVSDLSATGDTEGIVLSWTFSKGGRASFRILRNEIEVGGEECPSCPRVWELVEETKAGEGSLVSLEDGRYSYRDGSVRSGYSYAYRVVACYPRNLCGEGSNIAQWDME